MKAPIILSFILFISYNIAQAQQTNCAELKRGSITNCTSCINNWFVNKEVNKNDLKKLFENYFLEAKLVNNRKSKGDVYYKILKTLGNKPQKLVPFHSVDSVINIAKKLDLTIQDLEHFKQLNCISSSFENYIEQCPEDTVSAFYCIGDVSKTVQDIPNVHFALMAYSIYYMTSPTDFESELMQDAVVLLFIFQLSSIYGVY